MNHLSLENLVEPRAWKGKQSWNYQATWRLPVRNTVIRIDIHWDSYLEQSHIRAEVYNQTALCWTKITSIPPSNSALVNVSYVQDPAPMAEFMKDERRLVDDATAILSGYRRTA